MKNEIYLNLAETIIKYPNQRIGQLISNACRIGGWKNDDPFYCPDDILLAGLLQMNEKIGPVYNKACAVPQKGDN